MIIERGFTSSDYANWISEGTEGKDCVVDFGAGLFSNLIGHVRSKRKVGIELFLPYIDSVAIPSDIRVVHGDILEFEKLLHDDEYDMALMTDVLEHLEKDVALQLVDRIMRRFNTFFLMIPEGNHPQTNDAHGLGNELLQTHRSTWYAEDLLGFDVVYRDARFHNEPGKDHGCLFAEFRK